MGGGALAVLADRDGSDSVAHPVAPWRRAPVDGPRSVTRALLAHVRVGAKRSDRRRTPAAEGLSEGESFFRSWEFQTLGGWLGSMPTS